jgi:hypothetical protein
MPAADAFHPPLPDGPLMPLPPEEQPWPQGVVDKEASAASGLPIYTPVVEPEDPHDVATPGDEADAYVGPVDPDSDYCNACLAKSFMRHIDKDQLARSARFFGNGCNPRRPRNCLPQNQGRKKFHFA